MTKRLLATTALLLTVPLAFWLTGWHWQAATPGNYPLYLITQTAGKYGILPISAVLYALLWWTHRRGEVRALLLVALLAIGSTQVAKVLLKPLIAEPRPYIVAMTDADPSRIHAFYAQPRSERRAYVTHYYADGATPAYLSAHRASETPLTSQAPSSSPALSPYRCCTPGNGVITRHVCAACSAI